MKPLFKYWYFLFAFLSLTTHALSQTIEKDTVYRLSVDTLYSNAHFKIFVGQQIVIGKAAGERDWYETISFKSGASWPLVFLRDLETSQDLEYQMDPSIREKDKVKQYLAPGDTLTVTKIKRFGTKRHGYWYRISMGQKQGVLSLNFNCDIINAIKLGEVVIPAEPRPY
jgi:hypothetical protein